MLIGTRMQSIKCSHF